jgi:hypothetical protein
VKSSLIFSPRFDNSSQNNKNLKVYGKKSNSFIGSTSSSNGIAAGGSSIGAIFTRYTLSNFHLLIPYSFAHSLSNDSSSNDVPVKPLQLEGSVTDKDTSILLSRQDSISVKSIGGKK